MTSQHDKPKRWQFGLRVTLYAIASAAISMGVWRIRQRDMTNDQLIPLAVGCGAMSLVLMIWSEELIRKRRT